MQFGLSCTLPALDVPALNTGISNVLALNAPNVVASNAGTSEEEDKSDNVSCACTLVCTLF